MYSQKWNCAASFPNSTFTYLWAIYISSRSVHLFWCSKINGPIVEIHKSLTDRWMWKLGWRLRSFILGNICFKFVLQCVFSVLRVLMTTMLMLLSSISGKVPVETNENVLLQWPKPSFIHMKGSSFVETALFTICHVRRDGKHRLYIEVYLSIGWATDFPKKFKTRDWVASCRTGPSAYVARRAGTTKLFLLGS